MSPMGQQQRLLAEGGCASPRTPQSAPLSVVLDAAGAADPSELGVDGRGVLSPTHPR